MKYKMHGMQVFRKKKELYIAKEHRTYNDTRGGKRHDVGWFLPYAHMIDSDKGEQGTLSQGTSFVYLGSIFGLYRVFGIRGVGAS